MSLKRCFIAFQSLSLSFRLKIVTQIMHIRLRANKFCPVSSRVKANLFLADFNQVWCRLHCTDYISTCWCLLCTEPLAFYSTGICKRSKSPVFTCSINRKRATVGATTKCKLTPSKKRWMVKKVGSGRGEIIETICWNAFIQLPPGGPTDRPPFPQFSHSSTNPFWSMTILAQFSFRQTLSGHIQSDRCATT